MSNKSRGPSTRAARGLPDVAAEMVSSVRQIRRKYRKATSDLVEVSIPSSRVSEAQLDELRALVDPLDPNVRVVFMSGLQETEAGSLPKHGGRGFYMRYRFLPKGSP